uniref:NADH-ubiquinone oxidoreductase chain 6 n=1 Tax=Coleoptera sp. 23 KM-2017 TaxID=2219327 RepID=A0A346RK28_9COLE|nr:NADH dehydrogenase subunit 6 [Coleoptera sp. 23 KM-2017]
MWAILFSMTWMLSAIFMFLNHPLSFGLVLLLQTLTISLITGMMNYNFWFSYILFLVMVGGMLILFIYMTSVASDEKFQLSLKTMIIISIFMMFLFCIMFTDFFFINSSLKTYEIMSQTTLSKNELSLSKFLNWPSSSMMIMMIVYLLITLIMVVKITDFQYGPLRQKY